MLFYARRGGFAVKMKKTTVRVSCIVLLFITLGAAALCAQVRSLRVTYLYDNTAAMDGVKPDWGFSCLIEADGKTILFDTGANADVLRQNLAALKVDLLEVDALVFSHQHDDHTAGSAAVPPLPGISIYLPLHAKLPWTASAAVSRVSTIQVPVGDPVEVFPGIRVQAELPGVTWEDSLTVDTPRGLVVIVGCAHPGIIKMLENIRDATHRPIYMVLGGFHLLSTPANEVKGIVSAFKAIGVQYAGPTHCTGDEAMRLFREAYGEGFIRGGVGTVVEVKDAGP
jgi:7,8-dihydropterin-6-yl-methyl-4-(beta-D-ribofuranosyl)aminobenzene 5'-phosphate synthase